jgi:hypothetical protein
VQQTKVPEYRLSKSLLDRAIKSGNEFGWSQTDFLEVVEAARKEKLAIIGGQVQYVLPEGTCELYWLSYDPAERQQNETWLEYCNRTATETINKFQLLISQTNIEREAITSFELLKQKSGSGTNINDYLTFILFFDDSETDNL